VGFREQLLLPVELSLHHQIIFIAPLAGLFSVIFRSQIRASYEVGHPRNRIVLSLAESFAAVIHAHIHHRIFSRDPSLGFSQEPRFCPQPYP